MWSINVLTFQSPLRRKFNDFKLWNVYDTTAIDSVLAIGITSDENTTVRPQCRRRHFSLWVSRHRKEDIITIVPSLLLNGIYAGTSCVLGRGSDLLSCPAVRTHSCKDHGRIGSTPLDRSLDTVVMRQENLVSALTGAKHVHWIKRIWWGRTTMVMPFRAVPE